MSAENRADPVWFDSHCHLFDVPEPAEALARARAAAVEGLLVCGTDIPTSRKAAELAVHEGVWAAAGLHPTSAREWTPSVATQIEELLQLPHVVAVGESGLDMYWDTSFLDVQRDVLEAHVDLAKRHDKALVIHTRNSVDEAMDALDSVGPPERLVFHCWSGSAAQMDRALGIGAYISFAGNVTFKNAEDLRTLAERVPDDRLLVETDSPYLAPVPHRGRPNEPAFVSLVGEAVAAARGMSSTELASLTTRNARAFLAVA